MDDDLAERVTGFYGRSGLVERLERAVRTVHRDAGPVDPEVLAPVDQLHTWGSRATERMAELVGVRAGERVLDVGGGLGGAARFLAARYGCRVTVVDLTEELCAACRLLDRLTGLDAAVSVCRGDAVDLPAGSRTCDLAWLQHATMNIEDKRRLAAELRRALAPGGRLALWEVVAGVRGPARLPAPWAEDAAGSFLVPAGQLRQTIVEAGFQERHWIDLTREVLEQMTGRRPPAPRSAPTLTPELVIPRMALRLSNLVRNLAEGRIGLVMAVFGVDG